MEIIHLLNHTLSCPSLPPYPSLALTQSLRAVERIDLSSCVYMEIEEGVRNERR